MSAACECPMPGEGMGAACREERGWQKERKRWAGGCNCACHRGTVANAPGEVCPSEEDMELEDRCDMCCEPLSACACCPDCGGHGDNDPPGSCGGGCDFCPPSRRCGTCKGTGQVRRSAQGAELHGEVELLRRLASSLAGLRGEIHDAAEVDAEWAAVDKALDDVFRETVREDFPPSPPVADSPHCTYRYPDGSVCQMTSAQHGVAPIEANFAHAFAPVADPPKPLPWSGEMTPTREELRSARERVNPTPRDPEADSPKPADEAEAIAREWIDTYGMPDSEEAVADLVRTQFAAGRRQGLREAGNVAAEEARECRARLNDAATHWEAGKASAQENTSYTIVAALAALLETTNE